MAQSQMVESPSFSLLDLPHSALSIITNGLTGSNKEMIMAACSKSFELAMLNAEITLKVTKDSKFAGFRKVLNSASPRNIHLQITSISTVPLGPSSTIAVLLGMVPDNTLTQLAASCRGKAWESITKVTIKGTMMRCLVPQFIALACPQLVHLKVTKPFGATWATPIFSSEPGDALPLILCSSLKHLEIDGFCPNLPISYHTPADLQNNLPNIDTLIFKHYHSASLITAFATQLTRLEVGYCNYLEEAEINAVRQVLQPCSNLHHLRTPFLFLPDSRPNLKVLKVINGLSDHDMQLLKHVPSLIELHVIDCERINQDWTKQSIPWRRLHIDVMLFTKLANLNLSNLERVSMGPNVEVYLPEPSEHNSRTAVQQAVDGLYHVGQVVVAENKTKAGSHFGESGTISWEVSYDGSTYEETAAELIQIAAQVVGPCRVCSCVKVVDRPLVLEAVLKWGRKFVESVCLGNCHDPQPFVWQALQQLDRLNTVVFWGENHQGHSNELRNMRSVVRNTAQHYVIPASRSLRVEYGFSEYNLEPAVLTEYKAVLCRDIQEDLPIGCKLARVDFFSMEDHEHYKRYGYQCESTAVWVAVVEPLQATA